MLGNIVGGLLNGVGPILGGVIGTPGSGTGGGTGGGGTGGGTGGGGTGGGAGGGATGTDIALNLNLGSLQLLNLTAGLGQGESLIVVDGSILKQGPSGALVDVGLDVSNGMNSGGSLIVVDGQILGRGNDGSLIDLDLEIGSGGTIIDTGDGSLIPALPALQLLNISASLLDGERLLLVNGDILKSNQNGSLVDLGLDVSFDRDSGGALIVVDGEILGRGADGALIDLGLDIGVGGWIDDGDSDGGGGNPDNGGGGGDGGLSFTDIFRFYNNETGAHFYTSSAQERDSVRANLPQFSYEGNVFDASTSPDSGTAVFRFYNTETRTHFYTTSVEERDKVIAELDDFNFEGVAYYAFENDGGGEYTPLYRFYNTETNTHFYTASDAERVQVDATLPQYQYEGVAYFVEVA